MPRSMPSDSPVIITDSSICIISGGDDVFTAVGDGSYTVTKKAPPAGIKLFGAPETPIRQSGHEWKVEILDASGATAVKVKGSDNSAVITVVPVSGSFAAVSTDELKHSSAFSQAQVTYNDVLQSQAAGACRIRFR